MPMTCFRVDASVEVGTGHLMECLALAESFSRISSSSCLFLTNGFEPACHILEEQGYRFRIVPPELSIEQERAWISGVLEGTGAGLLVCNLLDREDSFYNDLRGHRAILVVVLEDGLHRRVPGDIVVNFSILQDESFYRQFDGDGTRYCIGPRYMPMREEFHEKWRRPRQTPVQVSSIFVNQGGSDPFGLTARILRGLELLDLDQEIMVVVGSAVPDHFIRELKSLEKQAHNTYSFAWGVSPQEMGEIMERSDLAITAAGNTLYELAIFGVPSLVVCHHERHLAVARRFEERGAAINLGIGSLLAEEEIARATGALLGSPEKRQALSGKMKGIVDGLGCRRIADTVGSVW